MTMTMALRCRCGQVRGQVDTQGVAARAMCYCKDCQAYGHFLGTDVLDPAGGTEVAATLPAAVRFSEGVEHLACMSLSPKGLYRWYAGCCRTPIANTPRNPRMSYAGVVRACLDAPDAELDRAFGPLKARAETASAAAPVPASTASLAWVGVKVSVMLLKARLGGGYKDNPFFKPGSSEPLRSPQVLSLEERQALTP
ncbi:DUF6151 family protein [Massilia yuzhufengensis]|uniref:Uncharacterized conserved protein n=1 Tax=Massilia yuzhufengensis TaxID=1164594 RepID=A0A1I1P4Q9_9BURK|nr:DUF6151 family protein [Massilia yuzhufengensis]SFD04931.1 Uncharacterized conserved protein [Massilia yuzhufengensis]